MQSLIEFFSSPLNTVFYLLAALCGWIGIYWFELNLNGAFVGGKTGHPFVQFWKYFWEDVQWFLPGGLAKRTEEVRRAVELGLPFSKHSSQEIRENNLYKEVAKTAFGNPLEFWIVRIVVYLFIFGPFVSLIGSVVGLLILVVYLGLFWSRQFQWTPPPIVWW
jgi:hypothetical protein